MRGSGMVRASLRLLCVVSFCGIFILFSGCYLVSDEMVGGEAAVFNDDKLAGLWSAKDKPGFFLVLGSKDGTFSFYFFEKDFMADAEFYVGKTTRTGGQTFLNVRRFTAMGEKAADKAYIPALYKIEADKLTVSLFGTAPFDQAIQDKKIAGMSSTKTTYSSTPTRLSATGEEVAKFIVANLKKSDVLDKPVVFSRVKIP